MTESNGQTPEPKHDLSRMLIRLNADPEDILRIRLKEAEPEQRRSLKLNRGSWVPILLAVLALGLAAFLLLWPGSPLCQLLDRCGTAAEDVWTIEITPSEQDVSPEGLLSEMLTIVIRDNEKNAKVGEVLTVTAKGSGILKTEDRNVVPASDQQLTLRTGTDGAKVRYQAGKPGDTIAVIVGGRQETGEYKVPDAPTPPPTPPTATPTSEPAPEPRPELSMDIRANVNGQETDVAQPFQQLNYTIQIDNKGTGEARNVALQCKPPIGADFQTSTALLWNDQGMLSREGILIEPGQSFVTSLAFTVRSDAPENSEFVLDCTLTHGGPPNQKLSPVIRLEKPEPIRIVFQPERLDLGVNESVQLTIRVARGIAGEPIVDRELSIQAEPAELLASRVDPVRTDRDGVAVVPLQASGEVGSGQVTVQLVESGETGSAELIVRPTIFVPATTVLIRNGPSTTDFDVSGIPKGRTFKIIGQNPNKDWWQIESPDGRAWVKMDANPNTPVGNVDSVAVIDLRLLTGGEIGSGTTVPFYAVTGTTDADIFLALPNAGGTVEVIQRVDGDLALDGFEVVKVIFWVPKDLVQETAGSQPMALNAVDGSSVRWACWNAPGADPSNEAANCAQMPLRPVPLDVESQADDIQGEWRKVTAIALIKTANLQ